LIFVLLFLALLANGCASGPTRKASSVKSAKTVKSSAAELTSRNQSLLSLYSAEVEAAADKIISESPSAAARRQALLWKAEAIPVMQSSLLNTDPVAAALDTWAFIFQMATYMDRPAVRQQLGEFHSVVVATTKNMDAEMERLILTSAPSANVADLRRKAKTWADEHPIQASLAGRQSQDPDLIRMADQGDLGSMASVRALAENLGDIAARLNSYNSYAPKQARWQAELLLGDLANDPQAGKAMSDLGTVSNALASTSNSIGRIPEVVDQTRAAFGQSVEGERLAVQDFLRSERLEALATLDQERLATLAAIRNERLAATVDLRAERVAVLDALRSDEETLMNDVNSTTERTIQETDTRARSLIDHFFLRAFELVMLTVITCALAAWILLRRFVPRQGVRGDKLYDRAA